MVGWGSAVAVLGLVRVMGVWSATPPDTVGYYAYIEASNPRRQDDAARLVSPLMDGSAKCLTLWYLMSGDSTGNLTVYTRAGPSQLQGTLVFRRSGQSWVQPWVQSWVQANVHLSSPASLQVVIEATRGSGYRGDIAIDDISFADGECPRGLAADGDVRLMDGLQSWEGRVEIYLNGQWGTVCDDIWEWTDASVVCRQLGLKTRYAEAHQGPRFGWRSGILQNKVRCRGNESRLTDCPSHGVGIHNCTYNEEVGVACVPPDTDTEQMSQCGTYFTSPFSATSRHWISLTSYGFPSSYGSGSDCQWVIRTRQRSGYVVQLAVDDMDLAGAGYICERDNVTIYDGGVSAGSKRLATLCKTGDEDRRLYSSGRSMVVRFQSGQYPRGIGFRLDYKAYPWPPGSTTTTTTTTTTRRSVAKTATTPMVPYDPPESHSVFSSKAAYAIGLSVTGVVFVLILIVVCRLCHAKRTAKPTRGATTAVQMASNDVYFLPGSQTGARNNMAFSSFSLPDLYLPPAYPANLPRAYPANLPTACSPDQPPAYEDLKHDPLPSYTEAVTMSPLSAHFNAVTADTH